MAGSKKSKRKGRKKGKKGRKKAISQPIPLPLHTLTEIYTKLENIVRHLMDARVIARKKRIEAWLLAEEELNQKRDDAVFREHINNMLDDVIGSLQDISSRLDKEKQSIQKEVDRINEEYQKRLLTTLKLIETEEKKLDELKTQLKEFENLKKMVTQLQEQLDSLRGEYERVSLEIMIKSTHLRNQYLELRAELYNYLKQQLAILIAKVREYILPIAWDHMGEEERKNRCHRWSFKREDQTNSNLLEVRENCLNTLKSLEWEKQYYGTEWVFLNLSEKKHQRLEEKLRWKRRLKEIYSHRNLYQQCKKKAAVSIPQTQLKIVTDFQGFLQKQLSALAEANKRKNKHNKLKIIKEKSTPLENEEIGPLSEQTDHHETEDEAKVSVPISEESVKESAASKKSSGYIKKSSKSREYITKRSKSIALTNSKSRHDKLSMSLRTIIELGDSFEANE